MNISTLEVAIEPRRLSSSSQTDSVEIIIDFKIDQIRQDPRTGSRTLTGSIPGFFPREFIDFDLCSLTHEEIEQYLQNHFVRYPRWVCRDLASAISETAIEFEFGRKVFALTVSVTVTYEAVEVMCDEKVRAELMSIILRGLISRTEVKSLKMETESCSICLEDFSGSSKHGLTVRMNCSHCFHHGCILEWLERKNSCPMCRTVLYDR